MTTSATRVKPGTAGAREPGGSRAEPGLLLVLGTRAAVTAALLGLATVTICVVVGWIAAPGVGFGLAGALRAAVVIWLAGHHVAVDVRGAGRIGLLPMGLAVLPGGLLWRAGRAVVRHQAGPAHAIGIAFAVAAPYSLLAGVLAVLSRSSFASASLPWAVLASFTVAFVASGFGAARALAPWRRLGDAMPAPVRSVLAGAAGTLVVLAAAGSLATAMALADHVSQFGAAYRLLRPGFVGSGLLLLAQLAYLPNAVVWAICYMLGPGFAVGTGTIVAPTGAALGKMPAFPLLAAVPTGEHGWAGGLILAVPYLAGLGGGLIAARLSPTPVLEAAPIRGFCAGALAAATLGAASAFAGGSLGDGRLSVVGPSPWQTTLVAVLELGISAAVGAGLANWRRARARWAERAPENASPAAAPQPDPHVIFVDRWATGRTEEGPARGSRGPSALPGTRLPARGHLVQR